MWCGRASSKNSCIRSELDMSFSPGVSLRKFPPSQAPVGHLLHDALSERSADLSLLEMTPESLEIGHSVLLARFDQHRLCGERRVQGLMKRRPTTRQSMLKVRSTVLRGTTCAEPEMIWMHDR